MFFFLFCFFFLIYFAFACSFCFLLVHSAFACLFCSQQNEAEAAKVCDEKIRTWLFDTKKFVSHKRKRKRRRGRGRGWITKLSARTQTTPTANTPKRSTNATRRTTRSTAVLDDSVIFSPVAKSMFKTPVVKQQKQKRKQKRVEKSACDTRTDVSSILSLFPVCCPC